MITRPFRCFSFRPVFFFFSFPFLSTSFPLLLSLFPIPLSRPCLRALLRFLHDSERFEEKFENEWERERGGVVGGYGWILFFLRRTCTFEVVGLIENWRFSKGSFSRGIFFLCV